MTLTKYPGTAWFNSSRAHWLESLWWRLQLGRSAHSAGVGGDPVTQPNGAMYHFHDSEAFAFCTCQQCHSQEILGNPGKLLHMLRGDMKKHIYSGLLLREKESFCFCFKNAFIIIFQRIFLIFVIFSSITLY